MPGNPEEEDRLMNTKEILQDLRTERKRTEQILDQLDQAITALEACSKITSNGALPRDSDIWDQRKDAIVEYMGSKSEPVHFGEVVDFLERSNLVNVGVGVNSRKNVFYNVIQRFRDEFEKTGRGQWTLAQRPRKGDSK